MSGTPRVREAQPHEARQVLDVWQAAGSEPTVTDSIASVGTVIGMDRSWLLVAELNDRVVGTLIAAWDGWRGHLYRLAVLPEHRRRGIAAMLVEEGEHLLVAAGARRVDAIVLLDRPDAAGFWASAGFHRHEDVGRFTRTLPERAGP